MYQWGDSSDPVNVSFLHYFSPPRSASALMPASPMRHKFENPFFTPFCRSFSNLHMALNSHLVSQASPSFCYSGNLTVKLTVKRCQSGKVKYSLSNLFCELSKVTVYSLDKAVNVHSPVWLYTTSVIHSMPQSVFNFSTSAPTSAQV